MIYKGYCKEKLDASYSWGLKCQLTQKTIIFTELEQQWFPPVSARASLLWRACKSLSPRGPLSTHPSRKLRISHVNTFPNAIFFFYFILFYHVFIYLIIFSPWLRGNARGSGLEIVVTVQTKGGSPKRFEASSSRSLDYTTWHKIAVRIQESESLMRVYVDDSMINVFSFRYTPQPYPKDAQLRLGQVFEVYLENTGEITSRFRVSSYASRPYKIQILFTRVSTNVHLSY